MNFSVRAARPYEFYRSYHRGQLSAAAVSRYIIGGECKQKREPGRLSGGNQLRNCWSQAVLTGPCGKGGRAIYQINRGEEAIPSVPCRFHHRRRMMGPARRSGLHMSESDQVSARSSPPSKMEGNVRVSRAKNRREGEGRRRAHAGHAISKPAVDRDCIANIVSSRVSSSVTYKEKMQTSVRSWGSSAPPLFATVQNFRGALSRSRDENTEKCNNATALKYEKECDNIVLYNTISESYAARNETSSE